MIEVTGVSVQRGGRELFRDFSLTLPDPGLYGIRGGTGSGKTLLARLIGGGLRPRQGKVELDGSPVYTWLQPHPPVWSCDVCADVRSAETLENYLYTTLYDAGGSRRDLQALSAIAGEALGIPLETSLEALSQGELALAQVALACVLPVRAALLDGHFSLLDEERATLAAQLLTERRTQPEALIVLFSTRFPVALSAFQAAYELAGGLPVAVQETAGAAAPPAAGDEPATDRRMLRVTLRGGRRPGVAYVSGTAYMVRGVLEHGLRIELLGELAQALGEMEDNGLPVKAIEWE